jgi:hypothetical protein
LMSIWVNIDFEMVMFAQKSNWKRTISLTIFENIEVVNVKGIYEF